MKISILALDKRKELWGELANNTEKLFNVKPELFIVGNGSDRELKYDHIDETQIKFNLIYWGQSPLSHYNAFLSHQKIFQRAYNENVDRLLLLEDDAYIIESRMHIWNSEATQDFIKNGYWDLLYLGWWMTRSNQEGLSGDREDLELAYREHGDCGILPVPRPPYIKHEVCGFHGVLINGHFLEVLTDISTGPYDGIVNKNFDRINAYYMYPKLIHTKTTWSYCENAELKRFNIQ